MDIPDGIELTAFDEGFAADPYGVYERLRRLDPIHKDTVSFYDNSWTIADYATVRRLLLDDRLSVDPRTIGVRRDPRADNAVTLRDPDMMNLDGPDHRRLRALVQRGFTPSSVERFKPRVEAIVESCLDALEGSTFDVVVSVSKPIPTIAIAEYLGIDSSHHLQFKQWTDDLLLQGYPMPTQAQWDKILAADQALRGFVIELIEERRRAPADDLVSRLIAAQEKEDRLSDAEIVDMCYLLIGAGNFTTTDLISNCIYELASAAERSDDVAQVVEECLRFDSPVLAVRRFVTQDIEVEGHVILRGSVVNLLLGAANHDPAVFDHADSFVSSRAANPHLTFGRGVHHCLGASLAKLEAQVTIHKFFERFPNPEIVSMKRSKRMDFRGFDQLVVS